MSTSVTEIDIASMFDTYIAGKQKVWKHDRTTTAGASEVFNCLRKQVFDKRAAEFGAEPDDDYDEDWGAMERGNILEDHFVVPALEATLPALGLELHFAGQSNQETLVLGRNSATPDGLITNIPEGTLIIKDREMQTELQIGPEGCIGLEFKSIDPRANLVEERSKHRYQSQVGLGLINEVTEWKPRYWVIIYVDASFVSKIRHFVIEEDALVYKTAKERAISIWEFDSPSAAPPEGKFDGGCEHCRWRKACGDATLSSWKQLEDVGENPAAAEAIHQQVMTYLKAKKDSEQAALEFEEAKQALKEALTTVGARRVVSSIYRVNWSTTKGKKTLDQKALKASGLVDLEPFMKTGAGWDTLTVTLRKEE